MRSMILASVLPLAVTACAIDDGMPDDVESTSEEITTTSGTGFAPGPYDLCDTSIQAHWNRHTYLGSPLQSVDQILSDGGRYRDYANGGTIVLNPHYGCAYVVRWGFRDRWNAEGRTGSRLGYPVSDETGDGHGALQFFEGGSMWWTQDRGVRALYGAIAVEHNAVRGYGGYPLTDAFATSEFGGQRVDLEYGHRIYYSKATGAHAVRYGILDKYVSMGAERSTLGLPTTDEICEPGHCWSDFQGGRLDWRDGVGVTVVNTIEDVSVWRLQVEIQTCDVTDAGTDDTLYVEVAGKRYYLDSAADDFERATTRRYDVSPAALGVSKVRDIQRLTIGETWFDTQDPVWVAGMWKWDGSQWAWVSGHWDSREKAPRNAVCLQRVAVYVNQSTVTTNGSPQLPIFSQTLPQVWLSSSRLTTTTDGATLRAASSWSTARVPSVKGLVAYLTFPELESIIEGSASHMLVTNRDAVWGYLHGRPVEVIRKNDQTVSVDLDLESTDLDGPEVDLDFDIHFECDAQQRLVFRVQNEVVTVDPAWYQVLSRLALLFVTPDLPALNSPTVNAGYCPTAIVFEGSNGVPGTVQFR